MAQKDEKQAAITHGRKYGYFVQNGEENTVGNLRAGWAR
jgi:hypothetical protein